MALGWISVLQLVPWGDVINNAPKVVDAAKRLWNNTAKKPAGEAARAKTPISNASPQARIDHLEEQVAVLHEQMLASSELIKALADQNAQLIKRVDANRIKVRWLSAGTVLALIVATTSLVLVLQR